jgi:hypothetical protein
MAHPQMSPSRLVERIADETGVGKVAKKVLKARFWAGRERMVGQ